MKKIILFSSGFVWLFFAGLAYEGWISWGWSIFFGFLFLIALYDVIQKRHTILRNFPIIGHFRYLFEMFRPEIQQYFIENSTTGDPIARIYRTFVYSQSKNELSTVPFGSELDFYSSDYNWLNHSCFPVHIEDSNFRVTIGNQQCLKPYSASLLNISAMSYGSLSKAAILALGRGAKAGGFLLNTGEGGLSPYHLETGADLAWQIGTAYFGTRDQNGYFEPHLFSKKSAHPHIKMIEIKLSQGAKPGHGGILPKEKVSQEVADIRQVEVGKSVISPASHSAFTTPQEFCYFIEKLRQLSQGKPIGFKLCLGRREEFIKICEAMVETKVYADFVTVDGGEGGTGAAPFDFINYVGSPLKEALYFVNRTLEEYDLRKHVKIIASGKIISAFNMIEKLALGADLCNSARGMMLALGCIQAYRCNTNKCPTGITTQDKSLTAGLNIEDKALRVEKYHKKSLSSLAELLGAAGLHSPEEVELKHISSRHQGRVVTLAELFRNTHKLSSHERHDRHDPTQSEPTTPTPPQH
jgi:glutamate synthase domain-containing protein 2